MGVRGLGRLPTALLAAGLLATAGGWDAAPDVAEAVSVAPPASPAALASDFNGDGFADLAVGALHEDIQSEADAGGVNLLFGSAGGITVTGDQFWSQATPGVEGAAEAGDWFGFALAAGDFDGDGFADLAVGAPGENEGSGAVNVLYGSAAGLASAGDQVWTQDSSGIGDTSEEGDLFGWALAAGRFNGDTYADLAIGIPSEDVNGSNEGAVAVLYGSADGLSATDQFWTQSTPGVEDDSENGDSFGWALSAANFGSGPWQDLAVGVPLEGLDQGSEGAVNVLYGSAAGLTATSDQLWTQDALPIPDEDADSGDTFGWSLAAANFGMSAEADLAVGVPGEDVDWAEQGAINVIYGSAAGLASDGAQHWDQDSFQVADEASPFDQFGYALAAGNFGNGAQADLAVGVPFEDIPGFDNAGVVNVLYGTPAGISSENDQLWTQNDPGVADGAETEDQFGFALAAANFGNGSQADLVIGVAREDLGIVDAGAVHVLSGSASGLTAEASRYYGQNYVGLEDQAETDDQWGSAIVG